VRPLVPATSIAPRRIGPIAVLIAAVVIVSTAAILIRFAQNAGVSSMAISAWRLGIASCVLSAIVAARVSARAEIASLTRTQWLLGIVSGAFLAAHIAAWITSLAYTSVASSTALVTTNPIWIALVSWLVFRERLGVWLVVGIAAAIGGSGLIFLSDARATASASTNPLLGNLLALLGSFTVCGYLLVGRRLRQSFSLLIYVWLVYSTAAAMLFATALLSGVPLHGYSVIAWACLIGLALGPQLLGHSGINWALKHVSASFVAVAILAEPIGSALLAWLIFDEHFAPLQLCGFVLLLLGIYLASRDAAGTAKPAIPD
jgi:drug/metabolite transporter (DMT)-like permease